MMPNLFRYLRIIFIALGALLPMQAMAQVAGLASSSPAVAWAEQEALGVSESAKACATVEQACDYNAASRPTP